MDNVSEVPSMRICAPNTWYVHEIPGTFLKDLTCSRKSCLVLENPVICEHNLLLTIFYRLLRDFCIC